MHSLLIITAVQSHRSSRAARHPISNYHCSIGKIGQLFVPPSLPLHDDTGTTEMCKSIKARFYLHMCVTLFRITCRLRTGVVEHVEIDSQTLLPSILKYTVFCKSQKCFLPWIIHLCELEGNIFTISSYSRQRAPRKTIWADTSTNGRKGGWKEGRKREREGLSKVSPTRNTNERLYLRSQSF